MVWGSGNIEDRKPKWYRRPSADILTKAPTLTEQMENEWGVSWVRGLPGAHHPNREGLLRGYVSEACLMWLGLFCFCSLSRGTTPHVCVFLTRVDHKVQGGF